MDELDRSRHFADKGRGTGFNPDNRFAATVSRPFEDGWENNDSDAPAVSTEVLFEQVKTIVSKNTSPDIPFAQSINPYRGCEHGCIYCYARPSHAYWDMSPGLDFETRIIAKSGAAERLREKLGSRGYQCKTISIGANTDPYQPVEANLKVTRSLLEVLQEAKHPFSIITKSELILRDLDLIAPLAAQNLCSVAVSVTTLDNNVKRILEPRAASGRARLQVIRKLSQAGVRVTMMVAPVIPCVNDQEIEAIVAAGADAGAFEAEYIFLRLPHEIADMFNVWLQQHYPQRAEHVMSIVRQSRGGKNYDSQFGQRMVGAGVFADAIRQRFQLAAKRHGLLRNERFELDHSQFVPPLQGGQLGLF